MTKGRKAIFIVIAVIALLLAGISVLSPIKTTRVSGDSMYPYLLDGDKLFYNTWTKDYKTGDVVILFSPEGQVFVKRIAASYGDTVSAKDGMIYINGEKAYEARYSWEDAWKETTYAGEDFEITLNKDQYFVLGDNRNHSSDSRQLGLIESKKILGKVVYILRKQ